jgi:ABC-type uncharacterized transport system fused permease/ATPase subunit
MHIFTRAEHVLLRLQDVTLCTPNYENVLIKGLTFELTQGERLLVTGPSGCGKSSLLRAIGGLWTAGLGKIETPPIAQFVVRIMCLSRHSLCLVTYILYSSMVATVRFVLEVECLHSVQNGYRDRSLRTQ